MIKNTFFAALLCASSAFAMHNGEEGGHETGTGVPAVTACAQVSLNRINGGLVRKLKAHYKSHPDQPQHTPCEALRPVVGQFLERLTQADHPLAPQLRAYLDTQSPTPLLALTFAFLQTDGQLSAEEREIFKHTPNWDDIQSLIAAHPIGIERTAVALDSFGTNHIGSMTLPPQAQNAVIAFLESQRPLIPYALLGKGKIPIEDFVNAMLGGVYPVCFPGGQNTAHGTAVGPFGFAIHDYFHATQNKNHQGLAQHILNRADAYFEKGGDAGGFVQTYQERALQKQDAQTEFFQSFVEHLRDLPSEQKRPLLAGLFFMLHEKPHRDPSIYETPDLADVIQRMTESSLSQLNHRKAWESPEDPLATNPGTGESPFLDAELTQRGRDRFQNASKMLLPTSYYQMSPLTDRGAYLASLVSNATVNRTPRFIDVILALRTGGLKRYVFPTLYHKMRNMEDSNNLLRFAGVSLPEQNLTTREGAIAGLTQTRDALGGLVTDFRDQAIAFARESGAAERYGELYRETEEFLKKTFPLYGADPAPEPAAEGVGSPEPAPAGGQ